ncbi:MAG: sigma-70 family RNA polymerase sigma factor [Alphaproteobacteria bacterium]|nr:sigma-70 family RNA polymerase sigma factor [Alphaproteobacteria bacterium]
MSLDNGNAPSFAEQLTEHTPKLRAFAISLSGSPTVADDLVQETLLRAWNNREKFEAGTNLKAWLLTILRNIYFNQWRRQKRSPLTGGDDHLNYVGRDAEQPGHMELLDVKRMLSKLPESQREALLLVGVEGLSYEEAAVIAGCAVGTVKSRLSRARSALLEMMEDDTAVDGAAPVVAQHKQHAAG